MVFTGGSVVKNWACQYWRAGFNLWICKIPWRRKSQSIPVFLPGNPMDREEPGRLQSMELQKSQTQLSDWTTIKFFRNGRLVAFTGFPSQESRYFYNLDLLYFRKTSKNTAAIMEVESVHTLMHTQRLISIFPWGLLCVRKLKWVLFPFHCYYINVDRMALHQATMNYLILVLLLHTYI